jgi:hypothetical protein
MDPNCRTDNPNSRILNPKTRIWNSQFRILNPRIRTASPKFRIASPKLRIDSPNSRSRKCESSEHQSEISDLSVNGLVQSYEFAQLPLCPLAGGLGVRVLLCSCAFWFQALRINVFGQTFSHGSFWMASSPCRPQTPMESAVPRGSSVNGMLGGPPRRTSSARCLEEGAGGHQNEQGCKRRPRSGGRG